MMRAMRTYNKVGVTLTMASYSTQEHYSIKLNFKKHCKDFPKSCEGECYPFKISPSGERILSFSFIFITTFCLFFSIKL